MGARDELHDHDPGPPTPSHCSSALKKSPARRGRTGCLLCPGRRSGYSGAPCSRSSILSLRCRLSTILRRRWWNSCQTSSIFCVLSHLILSRVSKRGRPLRTSVREPQLVEQLVVVQTIVSFSSLQRIAEQNVDIPVGGSGTGGGPSGVLPGQNYSITAKQIVDNPVPRWSFRGDLQCFPAGQSSSKRTANKIADIPVPGGGPQDFPQTLHRAGSSSDLLDGANQGFLALFHVF